MDDKEWALVEQVLSGDQEACMRLVNSYSRMVGTVIWRATGDDRIVEDLSQETFLRVFRALGYFDSRGKLSTWIYTIANRVAIDHLRKTSRWREESLTDESGSSLQEEMPAPESLGPGRYAGAEGNPLSFSAASWRGFPKLTGSHWFTRQWTNWITRRWPP